MIAGVYHHRRVNAQSYPHFVYTYQYDRIRRVMITKTKPYAASRMTISLDASLLNHFYKAVPEGERSRRVAELIRRDLEGVDAGLERLAWEFETHPDFQAARQDSKLWDNVASDF